MSLCVCTSDPCCCTNSSPHVVLLQAKDCTTVSGTLSAIVLRLSQRSVADAGAAKAAAERRKASLRKRSSRGATVASTLATAASVVRGRGNRRKGGSTASSTANGKSAPSSMDVANGVDDATGGGDGDGVVEVPQAAHPSSYLFMPHLVRWYARHGAASPVGGSDTSTPATRDAGGCKPIVVIVEDCECIPDDVLRDVLAIGAAYRVR